MARTRADKTVPSLPRAADAKARGITYTPKALASFVAEKIVGAAHVADEGPSTSSLSSPCAPLRILDPAVGHGQLLVSLLEALAPKARDDIRVHGYDTDRDALDIAAQEIRGGFPHCDVHLEASDFLAAASEARDPSGATDATHLGGLFSPAANAVRRYDLVIANPPYVRTQMLGHEQSRRLSRNWSLTGRVDLYHAFLVGIAQVLAPGGIAGVIVSNRFMTTKAGAGIRAFLERSFAIRGIWDLGDTKIFDAAVLPAVLLLGHKHRRAQASTSFVSIYQTSADAEHDADTPLDALRRTGTVRVNDGRTFRVRRGILRQKTSSTDVWRVATPTIDAWLNRVAANTWATFGALGKVRVGVKSCADRVFVRDDWSSLPLEERPELLRPLATHRSARCYKPLTSSRPMQVLYPHTVADGRRRAVELARYPRTARYLHKHRGILQKRKYLMDSGREWYELWVPQNPDAWQHQKLIFRDITAQPMFWVDLDGMVVNGDCYWWSPDDSRDDILWLAVAVGNSRFITQLYDYRFNNKLYAGRRRFMAQYVDKFPLPAPESVAGKAIIKTARQIFDRTPSADVQRLHDEIDQMIFRAFGLRAEEVER